MFHFDIGVEDMKEAIPVHAPSFVCSTCKEQFPAGSARVVHQHGKIECAHCGGIEPDYEHECDVCGQSPILPVSGMCGACTWGEAELIDPENW